MTYLGECTVVPDVAVVGEAVADKAQATFLDILLDRVEGLLLRYFQLCVSPSGHLDDHVEDAIVLVGEERDVVEGRHDGLVGRLFNEDTVFCRTWMSYITVLSFGHASPSVLAAPIWRVVYSMKGTFSTTSRTSGQRRLTVGHGCVRREMAGVEGETTKGRWKTHAT